MELIEEVVNKDETPWQLTSITSLALMFCGIYQEGTRDERHRIPFICIFDGRVSLLFILDLNVPFYMNCGRFYNVVQMLDSMLYRVGHCVSFKPYNQPSLFLFSDKCHWKEPIDGERAIVPSLFTLIEGTHLLAAVESLTFFPSKEAKCCSRASSRLLGA